MKNDWKQLLEITNRGNEYKLKLKHDFNLSIFHSFTSSFFFTKCIHPHVYTTVKSNKNDTLKIKVLNKINIEIGKSSNQNLGFIVGPIKMLRLKLIYFKS